MPSLIKTQPLTARKPAIGRGLGALLADARAPAPATRVAAASANTGLVQLAIGDLHADPSNPRRHFDEAALEDLAASLKTRGLMQPIVVRKHGSKGYVIVMGERRWRAAKKAGFSEVPVIVVELADAEAFEAALVENIQREDLNPLEEAEAYRRLAQMKKLTHEQVADRVGKDRSAVSNALRLLQLPNEVKQLLAEGDLEMGHARALLGLPNSKDMVTLAHDVVSDKLTVRETEARVKAQKPVTASAPKKKGGAQKQSPAARALVEDLQRKLGTRVLLVEKGGGKGTLQIEFVGYEDLERIVAVIRR